MGLFRERPVSNNRRGVKRKVGPAPLGSFGRRWDFLDKGLIQGVP